jgi:hypothetical protein
MNMRFEPSAAFVMKTGWVNPVITGVKWRAGGILLERTGEDGAADIRLDVSREITIQLNRLWGFFIGTSQLPIGQHDSRDWGP